MRLVSVFVAAATLVACAPTARVPALDPSALQAEAETQKRLVVEQHLADVRQLHRIVYPILAANADLCGRRVARGTGLLVETVEDQGWSFAAAARGAGLSDALTVIGIAEGSPAFRAGVAEGDRIVAAGGMALGTGRQAQETLAAVLENGGAGLALTLERAGERRDVAVTAETVCDMPYRVLVTEAINAYANGRELMATSGLLRFLGNDTDIAVIIGHEIAHNVMGHNTSIAAPGIAALYDFFGFGAKPRGAPERASQPLNQALEAEADYIGLYLMARAGFPVDAAANVYRRFAVAAPATILAREQATHPSSPARVVMLTQAAREIEAKRADGVALLPETKKE